jgi:hypothetical protein
VTQSFLLSLNDKQRDLVKHTCILEELVIFIREFLKSYGPKSQQFEDIICDLEDAFQERIFLLDIIEHLRVIHTKEHLYMEEDSKEV